MYTYLMQKNLKKVETYIQDNKFCTTGAASVTNELYLLGFNQGENFFIKY